MHTKRRPWRPQLTRAEMGRGWVFFALYLTVFPLSMGWVQRAFHGELPVAEANVVYYLLAATLVFLVFWTFLRHGFDLLLDWLPENLFAFGTGLVGAGVLHLLVMLIPLPVQNPNPESYAQQFALSPAATVVILVVLMPLVEEPLFRGLLFGATRRYSRVLGYVLSTLVFALYCVWQFVYSYGTVDFRYLLLFLQYVPMSLALTWCYDNGGSIWSPIALHMVLNALILASAVLGAWGGPAPPPAGGHKGRPYAYFPAWNAGASSSAQTCPFLALPYTAKPARSAVPPLPTEPASLGFGGGPIFPF